MKHLVDLAMMDRLDFLIRLQATGSPAELADRLGISYSSLYLTISFMKKFLKAPIRYNMYKQTFQYDSEPEFYLGFEKDRTQS